MAGLSRQTEQISAAAAAWPVKISKSRPTGISHVEHLCSGRACDIVRHRWLRIDIIVIHLDHIVSKEISDLAKFGDISGGALNDMHPTTSTLKHSALYRIRLRQACDVRLDSIELLWTRDQRILAGTHASCGTPHCKFKLLQL